VGQRKWLEFEAKYSYLNCTCCWPGRGQGRWWKRQLSKARRREAKERIRGAQHPRGSLRYETECNWKAW
jgi:hypothetical protein